MGKFRLKRQNESVNPSFELSVQSLNVSAIGSFYEKAASRRERTRLVLKAHAADQSVALKRKYGRIHHPGSCCPMNKDKDEISERHNELLDRPQMNVSLKQNSSDNTASTLVKKNINFLGCNAENMRCNAFSEDIGRRSMSSKVSLQIANDSSKAENKITKHRRLCKHSLRSLVTKVNNGPLPSCLVKSRLYSDTRTTVRSRDPLRANVKPHLSTPLYSKQVCHSLSLSKGNKLPIARSNLKDPTSSFQKSCNLLNWDKSLGNVQPNQVKESASKVLESHQTKFLYPSSSKQVQTMLHRADDKASIAQHFENSTTIRHNVISRVSIHGCSNNSASFKPILLCRNSSKCLSSRKESSIHSTAPADIELKTMSSNSMLQGVSNGEFNVSSIMVHNNHSSSFCNFCCSHSLSHENSCSIDREKGYRINNDITFLSKKEPFCNNLISNQLCKKLTVQQSPTLSEIKLDVDENITKQIQESEMVLSGNMGTIINKCKRQPYKEQEEMSFPKKLVTSLNNSCFHKDVTVKLECREEMLLSADV